MSKIKQKTITTLLAKPDLVPENLKSVFAKMITVKDSAVEIDKTIAQTQNSLNELYSRRDELNGAGFVLAELISDSLPEELVKQYEV
jgi:hypothetical protein